MRVTLMQHTLNPDVLCGQAAALCTNYKGDPLKAGQGAMDCGHESIAEHATFTFLIEDVSRVLLAQLTRHRLASFSIQSQRYCGVDVEAKTIPPSILDLMEEKHEIALKVNILLNMEHELYNTLLSEGVPEEDARYLTLQANRTKIVLTMNARELRHFFELRQCNRAQWEIRWLADSMFDLVKDVAPVLFHDAGPGCVRGNCPEKKRSCGHPKKTKGV